MHQPADQVAVLKRLVFEDRQTLGHFTLFEGVDELVSAKSLELPWRDNQKNISCIPTGTYKVKKRYSKDYGYHFLVTELDGSHVKGRTWILIHFGNYYQNTVGCILLGRAVLDINGDGLRDVTSSGPTINHIYRLAADEFTLEVV